MHVFNPRDWKTSTGGPDLSDPDGHLIRIGLIAALSLFCASFVPLAQVPDTFASLMSAAGFASAAVAALSDEPMLDAPKMTHWDEAAVSVALGLLAKIAFPLAAVGHAAANGG
jgi:hypothetical protein